MPSPSRASFLRPGLGLLGWLGLTFAAAALGAMASVHAATFYGGLIRPSWAPPGWLFGPVWSVLYLLMALAAWQVWRARGFRGARSALALYLVQLAVNAAWSWLFFVAQRGLWAFLDILVLDALVLATAIAFRRIRPGAAALLVPYLAWVAFATGLCLRIWGLNPERLG